MHRAPVHARGTQDRADRVAERRDGRLGSAPGQEHCSDHCARGAVAVSLQVTGAAQTPPHSVTVHNLESGTATASEREREKETLATASEREGEKETLATARERERERDIGNS